MDTDERISALEARLAEYDRLISRLIAYARLHPSGRLMLKMLGV